jgi:GntR family transcriptional regulator
MRSVASASTSRSTKAQAAGARFGRIAADLRGRIETGKLAAHQQLPSERELSSSYNVARMTVRQALAELEREGLVYRRPGTGTFVSEPRIGVSLGSVADELLSADGRRDARLLRVERTVPSAAVVQALGLHPDEEALRTIRLRFADGQPLAIETSHWSPTLMPDLFENLTEGSLWALARERYGLLPTRVEVQLETTALDQRESEQLGVEPGSAAFRLSRWTYDQRGRCFEFARDLYRGDRTAFRIHQLVPRDSGSGLLLVTE